PPTPGQPAKHPMPVPLKLALFDRETGTHGGEQLVMLDRAERTIAFEGFAQPPVLSINRSFSAPVSIERHVPREDLVFLAARDDDAFARSEAMQELVVGHLVAAAGEGLDEHERSEGRTAIREALSAILTDSALDDLMRGELMVLPGETYLAEQMLVADPGRIHAERESLKAWLAGEQGSELRGIHARASDVPYSLDWGARGARKVKTLALSLLAAGDPERTADLAAEQYDAADNMTDRQGALMVLAGLASAARTDRLIDFYRRYRENPLVIDKWFSLQAMSLHPQTIEHVKALRD